jgi:predicted transcriptional regulator YheO
MSEFAKRKEEFEAMKPLLESVGKGIARMFGDDCEVALHNLSGEIDHTIEFIENGHVTGRKKGDGASEIVLSALREGYLEDRYDYITHSKDGRMLKSSSIAVHDSKGDPIAIFSINYDISKFTLMNKTLNEFLFVEEVAAGNETISNNVVDLLENLIEESRREIGKPVSAMSREDKTRAIHFLDRRGALLIKKSSDRIAEFYGISKYTLYSYLGEPGAFETSEDADHEEDSKKPSLRRSKQK